MHIFDVENKILLKTLIVESLKISGVRFRLPKRTKENEKENLYSDFQIFQKPLHLLKKCVAKRLDGSEIQVPEFLVDACRVIEKDIRVEGIFRKAGSTCKQRQRKSELNEGKKFSEDFHVLDACSLVKLFFRELPQPIIPFSYHEIFLKCLLLPTYEKEANALLLATLLLPEENLATLAFFTEFLLKVSQHAEKNKMNAKNLAIILTPTLMPLSTGVRTSNNLEMAHHFKVIEMLIENAVRIGKVPEHIVENLVMESNKKFKKKRRSGSITRMFTGLKKIVSSRSSTVSEYDNSLLSTPDSLSPLGKRRNTSKLDLSAKKKRLTDSSLHGMLTPLRCRMHGYIEPVHLAPSSIPLMERRSCNQSSNEKPVSRRESPNLRSSRLNLVLRCKTKLQKSQKKLGVAHSLENISNFETEKPPMERKLSFIDWGYKKTSFSNLFLNKTELESQEESSENVLDLSDNDLITVSKKEYEDIKNRVSALEEDLEKLAAVHSVQTAFEKTLEESEKQNSASTDQLAKRLSRELSIRRNQENKIIRSPSARKIGSIRRRSREMSQKITEPKINLKRGRPNTVQSGLPSPRLRTFSNESVSAKKAPILRSASFVEPKDEWSSGEVFFARDNLPHRLTPVAQGRPSIAEIRCQNAGMVLEKAKLFNALNESNGTRITRRQSVRLENLRRMNEEATKKTLVRTRSLGSERKQKMAQELKDLHEACTPRPQRSHPSKHETPSIKKSLTTRSPRTFAKTPLSQVKSGYRGRPTPMKALVEGTPHIGLRRSPRILARSINTPTRQTGVDF